MAIFIYDKKKGKVVEVDEIPVKLDDTRNYVNMRKTWSNQTKMEFNTTTVGDSISRMGGDINS